MSFIHLTNMRVSVPTYALGVQLYYVYSHVFHSVSVTVMLYTFRAVSLSCAGINQTRSIFLPLKQSCLDISTYHKVYSVLGIT